MSKEVLVAKEKRCPRCGECKPRAEFYRNSSRKDGLSAYCKACIKEQCSDYYKRNKDACRERLKKWRSENPEKVAAQYARQRKNNEQGYFERQRRYRERHKHQLFEKGRRYRAENKRYFLEKAAQRRKLKKDTSDGTVTNAYLTSLLASQDYRCVYCKCDLNDSGKHLDHIVPLSRGGLHTASNVQWTCPTCNLSKGDLLEEEWIDARRLYKSDGIKPIEQGEMRVGQ